MISRSLAWSVLALGAAALAAPASAQGFRWTGKLAAGKRVEIKGVTGDIHAVAAAADEILVTAEKHARHSDPDEVEIKVVPSEDGVTICALYPTGRRARHENTCEPGEHWSSSTEDNDVAVDFTVHLPAGLHLYANTVNGDIEAEGLGGNVKASTVNGGIRLSTKGYGEAVTVNGSIYASLGRADWTDGVDFHTVNGGITLELPASFSAEVRAETVNGDIETEFPLTVTGRFGPRHMRGTIGTGGRELDLGTVNGSIRLRKST
jgi:putative adhesin